MADTGRSLQEEFAANREALQALTEEIGRLSARLDIERRWRIALIGVIGTLMALSAFVAWFAISTRADLRDFGERLFLNSCADVNESRANGNEGRTQQAEILIKLFDADNRRPDLAEQYRQLTRDLNAQFPQRDCEVELHEAS